MTLNNPSLTLTFLGNDLEGGHSTTQTIDSSFIINRSVIPQKQLFNNLKSSSDQFQITIARRCPSTDDIIATEGNIKAQLTDGEDVICTGFLSTSYSFNVTNNGEQALKLTIESIGTRLFSQPFIESGHTFFETSANAVVYQLITPLGLSIHEGDERKILQSVSREVEAGETVRELLDQLFYECNAVYSFNNLGELCITVIDPSTTGAQTIDSTHLFNVKGKAISVSKALRTYKGARVKYNETAKSSDYLVYRNTTGADDRHPYCNMKLGPGEWFDGVQIYTDAEWSAATADTFREPTLISAVNAGSESTIVGSGQIVSISNAHQSVIAGSGISVSIEAVGGKWFKITAHNSSLSDQYIERMDLYADIVYTKNIGVIRTQIDGPVDGKSLLEEELSWIHDKENAQRHGNLLAQYYKHCGAVYTFYSDIEIPLGSVKKLHDDVFSGLEVYVMVYAAKGLTDSELIEYKAVGISTFDLDEPVYHGTSGTADASAAQGPQGEPGDSTEVQYAIGSSIIDPPSAVITWQNEPITWNGDPLTWNAGLYSDDVPEQERGKYIWMRTRVGDGPWQYTRLTGSTSWDAENLGVFTTACPTESREGLGLIPGDYFIAGVQFVDGGVTYKKGYAYEYNGSGWDVLDLSDEANSGKALQCLSDLMTSGVNVTDSTASIWGWFQNLVAQNAVIQNLIAQNLRVGPGTGQAGSGFRFRALDNNGSPIFDIMYGDATLFSVDILTGKIYFGQGFCYDPTTQAIHSNNDNLIIDANGNITATNAIIGGSSEFHGLFDCDVIATKLQNPSQDSFDTTSYQSWSQVRSIIQWLQGLGFSQNVLIPASITGTSAVAYISFIVINSTIYRLMFYDSSRQRLDCRNALGVTTNCDIGTPNYLSSITQYSIGTYITQSATLNVFQGGNKLWVDIPSSDYAPGLTTGMLYYTSDGTVKIKL